MAQSFDSHHAVIAVTIDQTANAPTLPAVYELVIADERELDAADAAIALAERGYDEGTLVWIQHPRPTHGVRWRNGSGNMDCALLLRPEFDLATTQQLLLVGSLSLGKAIAAFASPMTPLEYAWPNDIIMAGMKAGAVDLHTAPVASRDGVPAWAVLRASVNVHSYPEAIEDAISIQTLEGKLSFTVADLLTAFSREFLNAINDWAEEGLTTMLPGYLRRMIKTGDALSKRVALVAPNEPVRDCALDTIDDDGALHVIINGTAQHTVTLHDWQFNRH